MNVQNSMIAFGKGQAPVRFQGTDAEGRYVKEVVVPSPMPGLVPDQVLGEARPPREWWAALPDVVEGLKAAVEDTVTAALKAPDYFKPGADKMLKAASEVIQDQINGAKDLFNRLRGKEDLTPQEEHQAVGILENAFDRLSGINTEMEPMNALHDKVCGTGAPEDEQVHTFLRELGQGEGNRKLGEALGRQNEVWAPIATGVAQNFMEERRAEKARQAEVNSQAKDLPPALRAQLGLDAEGGDVQPEAGGNPFGPGVQVITLGGPGGANIEDLLAGLMGGQPPEGEAPEDEGSKDE